MDYRERKYFLIRLNYYNKELKELKELVPSIEFHAPYNHFNNESAKKLKNAKKLNNLEPIVYDGDILRGYIQQMVSCKIEDSEKLLSYFKSKGLFTYIIEITKEKLRQ